MLCRVVPGLCLAAEQDNPPLHPAPALALLVMAAHSPRAVVGLCRQGCVPGVAVAGAAELLSHTEDTARLEGPAEVVRETESWQPT